MSALFDRVRAKVLPILKSLGQDNDCFLVKNTEATALDPDKPWDVTPGTPVKLPFKGLIFDVKIPINAKGEVDKDCIIPGDVGATPDLTYRIEVTAGEHAGTYAIVAVNNYAPDGVSIGFKCRLGKWPATRGISTAAVGAA